jgi:peptidyl-prolyl cis-trans isomerase SurA
MRISTVFALVLAAPFAASAFAAPPESIKPTPTVSPQPQASPSPAISPAPNASPAPSPGPGASPSPSPLAKAPIGTPPTSVDRLEASVNASLIFTSDVARFKKMMKLRSQLDPLFAGTQLAQEGENAPTNRIVDFLIDEHLIAQEFPVTDSEVEQEINGIQSNNKIDRTQLKGAIAQQGATFEDYFELIRVGASKRNLIDKDIRTKVTITDDDIKNYFYTHYAQDKPGNRVYHLQAILISPKSYKTPAAAKDVAQKALKDINSGESFEDVAKRVSDDASASAGGDLGELTESQMSPLIRENVQTLKIGQVSSLLGNTKAGFYILRLMNVESDENARLEKMKDEIRNQLVTQEYQHQIALWLERQRQTAFIHRAGESSIAGIPGQTN